MESEKKFKTKTGFCHILPDKIVLTRDGVVGNMAKVMLGNNISRILIIYGLIAIALIYCHRVFRIMCLKTIMEVDIVQSLKMR